PWGLNQLAMGQYQGHFIVGCDGIGGLWRVSPTGDQVVPFSVVLHPPGSPAPAQPSVRFMSFMVDFAMSSNGVLRIPQGGSADYTISLASINNFAGYLSLTAT